MNHACGFCHCHFAHANQLWWHYIGHHGNDDRPPVFCCGTCLVGFLTWAELYQHLVGARHLLGHEPLEATPVHLWMQQVGDEVWPVFFVVPPFTYGWILNYFTFSVRVPGCSINKYYFI